MNNAELEERVASLTAALAEANQELQKLGYSVGHDLGAPLRAMAGYARVLSEDFSEELGEEGMYVVGRIAAAAVRMDQISESLLRSCTIRSAVTTPCGPPSERISAS